MLSTILDWLGIGLNYLIAAALIAAGAYLALFVGGIFAKLLRSIGILLIWAGTLIGYGAYVGERASIACETKWKQKNYEARIARLQQEAAVKKLAADLAMQQANKLASQNDETNSKIADYESDVDRLSSALASCRRATGNDDKRMCDILGAAAAGCANSK